MSGSKGFFKLVRADALYTADQCRWYDFARNSAFRDPFSRESSVGSTESRTIRDDDAFKHEYNVMTIYMQQKVE